MQRLFQSLRERAGFCRAETSGHGGSRTVRTDVTVEREETTVLVGGVSSWAFDTCPFCGHKIEPARAAQVRARLEGRPGNPAAPR